VIDLLSTLRKSILKPRKLVSELWNYDYKDFRLIFEQSDVLHYFYVSSRTQRLLSRSFIVVLITTLCLIAALVMHSAVSVWRYKNLEASKLEAEEKRREALSALAELSEEISVNEGTASHEDLIKVAHGYRDRLNRMQTLIEFSSQELKLASSALEKGLKASGVADNQLQKIRMLAVSARPAMGGVSNEIKFDGPADKALESYRLSLVQLEQLKQVYKFMPSESPVSKAITSSKFGVRVHPITNKLTVHEGLDYVPTFDGYAKSVLPGVVEKIQRSDNGYGNMVVLLHPGKVRTIYAHLDSIDVRQDQKVDQGEILGKIGNTGSSTGKHLHYEISIDNIKINPSIITAMAKNVQ